MTIKYTPIFLALMLAAAGCGYDAYETAPPAEELPEVSFSQDVLPILTNNCTASGCHGAGGIRPILTEDKAYDEIMDMGLVNLDDPPSSELYEWMDSRSRSMPPSGRLEDDKVIAVLAWITQGAKED